MYYDKILIIGTGKFAFQCTKIVSEKHHSVSVLEYKTNRNISTLESLCKKNSYSYGELNDEIFDLIEKSERYLIISAFNTYIFKNPLINSPNIDIINFHPSLLPKHPGRNPEAWAIFEGDKSTGITWHEVTAMVDQGDIIDQGEIDIDEFETSLSLMIKQNKKGIEVLKKIIGNVLTGNITARKQHLKDYKYHKSYDIPNNGYLDLSWKDSKKSQFLRAMDYGKLKILGIPKIKIDCKEYSWNSYKIIGKYDVNKYRSCDMRIEGVEKDIILEDVEEING